MTCKWIVCGTANGASVWDGELHQKAIEVEVGNEVDTVDVSTDSTSFATGTNKGHASVWSITTGGQRLVGPLRHADAFPITGVRFSASGEHFATASW